MKPKTSSGYGYVHNCSRCGGDGYTSHPSQDRLLKKGFIPVHSDPEVCEMNELKAKEQTESKDAS